MVEKNLVIYPGIESGVLNITSSSVWNSNNSADRCRMDYQKREGAPCWCAAHKNINQYLQLSSPIPFNVHKIVTAGRWEEYNEWITSYLISYTIDGNRWISYNNGEILKGNTDGVGKVENELIPFIARSVRIKPLTWENQISLKVELHISDVKNPNERLTDDVLIPAIEIGMPVMVSSVWDPSWDASRIRINYSGNREGGTSWLSGAANENQWVMVSTVINKIWCKIYLQGRGNKNEFVSKFYISYTANGKNWYLYKNGEVINGNNDESTVVHISLVPFMARSIKIHPLAWSVNIGMRLEAYFTDC